MEDVTKLPKPKISVLTSEYEKTAKHKEEPFENIDELEEEETEVKTSFKKVILVFALIIGVAFGGFTIWALVAPLDEGIPAGGIITVAAQRKEIQHLTGGIVRNILVNDGDYVVEGTPLIILDDAQAKAQLGTTRAEYLSALILEARFAAERMDRDTIELPPEVRESLPSDERLQAYLALQKEILTKRRENLKKNLQIIKQNIKELETYAAGLEKAAKAREAQIATISQQKESLGRLVEEGYFPRNRYLEIQRTLAETITARESEIAQIARIRQQIAELNLKIEQEKNNYMREVEDLMGEAHKKVEALREQYEAARQNLENTVIKAPISGTVMNLSVHTIGGVIPPGKTILEIVPDNSDLIVEAYVSPNHIEKVYAGLETYIRFTSLVHSRSTPTINGHVIYVSPDRMVDKDNKPYYLCRVSIPYEELGKLPPSSNVRPGMPVDVIIKTGERTFFQYLIRPLQDRLAKALKEQ